MRYCKKCVMPDTRPGISFNDDGICSACQAYEKRKNIDWNARWKEFEEICSKYRGMNGDGYDCAVAVSGGKDSHYQVHLMKNVMHMNPILFSVEDNFPMTEAGKHNLKNISEEFGCNEECELAHTQGEVGRLRRLCGKDMGPRPPAAAC